MKYSRINPINLKGFAWESVRGSSKFVRLKINNINHGPILLARINHWGLKEEDRNKRRVVSQIKETSKGLLFYSVSKDVDLPRHLVGYPSIIVGRNPWDKFKGFEMGQVKKYKKMDISTQWDFNCKGYANFVYDVWLTKNREGGLTSNDLEIMVWLNYTKGVDYWEDLGSFGEFNVRYKRKEKDWNKGGHVIAFVYPNNKKFREFDLFELIKYCKRKIKGIDDYWIRSIELGTEFGKNTEVKIKLKKMDMDFVRKSD